MESRLIDFSDELHINRPFLLYLGRKPRLISEPSRFQIKREHIESTDEESGLTVISQMPVRESFSLFIGNKLFSTTYPTGTRRPSARVSKPTGRRKNKPMEIHLVKKYTTIH